MTTNVIMVNPIQTTSYSVTVTDLNGCTDVETIQIETRDRPTITIVQAI